MTIALGSCRRFGGPALLCALLVASACGGRASEAERRAHEMTEDAQGQHAGHKNEDREQTHIGEQEATSE